MSAVRTALVTGGNRGLGREAARQLAALGYTVVVTGRDGAAAEAAARQLAGATGATVVGHALDVTDTASAEAAAAWFGRRFEGLHALVNNAGVILPGDGASGALEVDPAVVARTVDTNVLGALRVTQAFAPHLRDGNVVNVSSGMGGIAEMGSGYPGYRISKAALNALTRLLHHELAPNVRVNAVCPGWVRTEMGGAGAPRSVEEGARGIVWAATLGEGGPSGGFFRDGQPVPW